MEVIGTAVQQDGPSASLTAPNGSSQRRLIESVSRTITDSDGVSSLEAHGTGTALGDPIEVCYISVVVSIKIDQLYRWALPFVHFAPNSHLYNAPP